MTLFVCFLDLMYPTNSTTPTKWIFRLTGSHLSVLFTLYAKERRFSFPNGNLNSYHGSQFSIETNQWSDWFPHRGLELRWYWRQRPQATKASSSTREITFLQCIKWVEVKISCFRDPSQMRWWNRTNRRTHGQTDTKMPLRHHQFTIIGDEESFHDSAKKIKPKVKPLRSLLTTCFPNYVSK